MPGLVSFHEFNHLILDGRSCSLIIDRPYIVGILNVTPDSFSDGGRFFNLEKALDHGRRMVGEGADLIDIGGESTRPGSRQVTVQEELDRILPVVEALGREFDLPLSIDTTKSSVAKEAIAVGADFINDISGLTFDENMAEVIADSGTGVIVMHTSGRPDVMQKNTCYDDVVKEVFAALCTSIEIAEAAGVARQKIAIDPGIGFGKDVSGNLELLRCTAALTELDRPIMLGTSRKGFIGQVLGQGDPKERLAGTLATIALGYAGGARLFRVHDVAAARQAALMAKAICRGSGWSAS
ncbi:MAG: dihydropteroate synthase [Desulfuromonadales bacterium]|nr:dihydropteroate synthase [Desulfuromonadales bacterium]